MKKLIFILTITLTVISCGTSSLTNKTKRLELGMTKKKVLSLMGEDYKIVSASKTSEGDLEVISYNTISDGNTYVIYLLNGKLEKWHEVGKRNRHPRRLR